MVGARIIAQRGHQFVRVLNAGGAVQMLQFRPVGDQQIRHRRWKRTRRRPNCWKAASWLCRRNAKGRAPHLLRARRPAIVPTGIRFPSP